MIDYSPTHGHAHTTDPQYNRLSGRVTYQSEIVGITLDGWKVRCIVSYIDIGRAADVAAGDPDAAMRAERLPQNSRRAVASFEGIQRAKAARALALRDEIATCLAQHGPHAAVGIARLLGNGAKERILEILRRHPERFVFLGGQQRVWGLVGQSYAPVKREIISPTMRALRAAIEEFGPQTALELARRLGVYQTTVHNSLMKHPSWFRVVEVRKGLKNLPSARVWGLR